MSRAKRATLKNGQGRSRRNQCHCQIDLSRPRLQRYFLELGQCETTADKRDDTCRGVKPTQRDHFRHAGILSQPKTVAIDTDSSPRKMRATMNSHITINKHNRLGATRKSARAGGVVH